jgi:hypothetical protein
VLQWLTRVWQLYRVHKREYCPGVKRPAIETDPSTLTSSEVKNDWSYASTPTYAFMVSTCISLLLYLPWQNYVYKLNIVHLPHN